VGQCGAASTTQSSSSGKQCNVHPNPKHPDPYRYAFRSVRWLSAQGMHVFVLHLTLTLSTPKHPRPSNLTLPIRPPLSPTCIHCFEFEVRILLSQFLYPAPLQLCSALLSQQLHSLIINIGNILLVPSQCLWKQVRRFSLVSFKLASALSRFGNSTASSEIDNVTCPNISFLHRTDILPGIRFEGQMYLG
jgi:hypothetical protein